MENRIYHQSVFETWSFEDKSMQAIITSPPFYSLRKYSIPDVIIGGNPEWEGSEIAKKIGLKCEHEWGNVINVIKKGGRLSGDHPKGCNCDWCNGTVTSMSYSNSFCLHCSAWKGQYGLEPDYKLYVEHSRLWAKEAWRVLRDDGVMFLNLGDSYCGGGRGHDIKFGDGRDNQGKSPKDLPSKCQLLIPHRVAMALIDDGWILRNTICWYKPNAMPESCKDRFSKKYEYVFMFSKNQRYYFDLDGVREEHIAEEHHKKYAHRRKLDTPASIKDNMAGCNPKGKNPGDIWRFAEHLWINLETGDITNCPIQPDKINYMKIYKKDCDPGDLWTINTSPSSEKHYAMWPQKLVERMILCSTKPGDAVLDPFCGSGTTLRVAEELNRVGYGIDLGYEDIQERKMSLIQKSLL